MERDAGVPGGECGPEPRFAPGGSDFPVEGARHEARLADADAGEVALLLGVLPRRHLDVAPENAAGLGWPVRAGGRPARHARQVARVRPVHQAAQGGAAGRLLCHRW